MQVLMAIQDHGLQEMRQLLVPQPIRAWSMRFSILLLEACFTLRTGGTARSEGKACWK